jgi:protocatechuate 3,4-dioxygenase, beta subunit
MNKQEKNFSRRRMLEMALGLGGGILLGGANGSVIAQEAKRLITWPLPLGPFYPQIKLLDQDADLTMITGKPRRAEGKVIHLMGRVMNLKGEPVSGVKVEIWQTDSKGRYVHPTDENPVPADPNFQGYATQITDAEGRYRFKTVKPAAYPVLFLTNTLRTPHIHFEVSGKIDRVVTQMFFPNEPLNAQDGSYGRLKLEYKEAALAKILPPTKELEPDSVIAVWDIVLPKG